MRRVAYIVVCAAVTACTHSAPLPDFFKQGEDLYLKGDYAAAAEAFKKRLLQAPDDAGAHFYLGTCYLNDAVMSSRKGRSGGNFWLGIAQGELETALAVFERQGKVNPIPRFNAQYFEMICHVNQAKIYLHLLDLLSSDPRLFRGLNASAVPGILQKCIEQAHLAEQVAPDNAEVAELKRLIDGISGAASPNTARPRGPSFSA